MKIDNFLGMNVSKQVAEEFSKTVQRVVETNSSLRNILEFPNGAKSLSKNIAVGRKYQIENNDPAGEAIYSYHVLPMIEPKFYFEISKDELLMIEEGLEPYELDALEETVKKLIDFEEKVFFEGLYGSETKGLLPQLTTSPIITDGSPQSMIDSILKAAIVLRANYIKGPYKILMGKDILSCTSQLVSGKTLAGLIEEELEEDIEVSNYLEGALLLPLHPEDIRVHLAKEITLGVDHISNEKVRFYLTEAFQFKFLNPKVAVPLKLDKKNEKENQ